MPKHNDPGKGNEKQKIIIFTILFAFMFCLSSTGPEVIKNTQIFVLLKRKTTRHNIKHHAKYYKFLSFCLYFFRHQNTHNSCYMYNKVQD